ncbi:hypothetical protein [Streptomyces sp. 769]|uniref:hypothetical protein n=1 Tax=Streptomyces sp. 769 TaxID=1262452 RepID=UPI00057D0295|nr:hypothetical protein [Streptomyces sp. 769]
MEPITERRPVNGPRVYGYLRQTSSKARHNALADSLAEYCRQHELTLCGLFTEWGPITEVRSPAFVGLLDVLALPDAYGVVLPARVHLGPKRIAVEREQQIAQTSARLIVVRAPHPRRGDTRPVDAGPRVRQREGT